MSGSPWPIALVPVANAGPAVLVVAVIEPGAWPGGRSRRRWSRSHRWPNGGEATTRRMRLAASAVGARRPCQRRRRGRRRRAPSTTVPVDEGLRRSTSSRARSGWWRCWRLQSRCGQDGGRAARRRGGHAWRADLLRHRRLPARPSTVVRLRSRRSSRRASRAGVAPCRRRWRTAVVASSLPIRSRSATRGAFRWLRALVASPAATPRRALEGRALLVTPPGRLRGTDAPRAGAARGCLASTRRRAGRTPRAPTMHLAPSKVKASMQCSIVHPT